MNQSKLGSLIEAIANLFVGFAINLIGNMVVLPWFGFNIHIGQAFSIGLVFTVISLVRQYVLRRWFNARLHRAAQSLAVAIDS